MSGDDGEASAAGEGDATAGERRSRARTSAWLFSFKAVAATIGGALLTFCVTIAQISYQQSSALLQRQREQGIQFQQELLVATGNMENEIVNISSAIKDLNGTRPRKTVLHKLDELNAAWRLSRLPFRVRGSQIYGIKVGNLIYDPAEEATTVDRCSVEVPYVDREGRDDCVGRQVAEIGRLNDLVALLRSNVAHRETHWRPAGFQANFRMTRAVAKVYIACILQLPEANHYACPAGKEAEIQRRQTKEIFERRVELLVLSRERLSTEIIHSSSLE